MVTRARIFEACSGECNQGRNCTCRPERRIRFDHRLLMVVLAVIYIPLFVVIAWALVERAS